MKSKILKDLVDQIIKDNDTLEINDMYAALVTALYHYGDHDSLSPLVNRYSGLREDLDNSVVSKTKVPKYMSGKNNAGTTRIKTLEHHISINTKQPNAFADTVHLIEYMAIHSDPIGKYQYTKIEPLLARRAYLTDPKGVSGFFIAIKNPNYFLMLPNPPNVGSLYNVPPGTLRLDEKFRKFKQSSRG